MTIHYNVHGKKRKELAKAIGEWLEVDVKYLGAPTFAYEIDYFTLDRDGNLTFDDRADSEVIERLLEHLYDESFECDMSEQEETTGLTISVPFDKVSMGNLTNLLDAKGSLIKKALGIDSLRVEMSEDKVSFPWFSKVLDADTANAYTLFISALCKMSLEQKRINATEKPAENEKYAFRCFLLRLGFIGNEYKAARKILLRNLEGSSAFKGGKKDETSE